MWIWNHFRMSSIFTHLTGREKTLLANLAKQLPRGSTIVEIGSYLGASTCYLASGARLRDGKVYAVDTWTNLAMSEGTRDSYADFIQNTALFKNWIVPLRGLSSAIAQELQVEIDLLFVDGDHSYEAVCADLEAWIPKVKEGGIVVFHDYDWAVGVRQAVRKLIVPVQVEGGRRLDHIYWTRISHQERVRRQGSLHASVIVPTYGHHTYLRDTLCSLLCQNVSPEECEIIVVDNKPTGETRRMVQSLWEQQQRKIRYIEECEVGLHNARHTGAKIALGNVLIYVDNDVIVYPGWLSAILEPFKDPLVAMAGGNISPQWESKPPEWVSQFPRSYLSLLNMGEKRIEIKSSGSLFGCNMAIRRSVLYEVGGFNPDAIGDRRFIWFRGDGETGLQKKVSEAGYKIIYEPQASVWHRIPPERLEAKAFYNQGFLVGLSCSYSHLREAKEKRFFYLQIICHTFIALLHILIYCTRAMCQRKRRIRFITDAWLWYGYGAQHLYAILSPRLREFLLKDSYLLL